MLPEEKEPSAQQEIASLVQPDVQQVQEFSQDPIADFLGDVKGRPLIFLERQALAELQPEQREKFEVMHHLSKKQDSMIEKLEAIQIQLTNMSRAREIVRFPESPASEALSRQWEIERNVDNRTMGKPAGSWWDDLSKTQPSRNPF